MSSKVSLQFEEFTEIKVTSLINFLFFKKYNNIFFQLSESDKLCLLCQNELNYFARVRKDLQEIHLKQEINLHVDETANMSCYYCIKPFKDDEKMFGLNDKLASQFKDFTGIDVSITEIIKTIIHKYEIYNSRCLMMNIS